MSSPLVAFAASAALLQPSVAFNAQLVTCQALADSQMQPVYLVSSSDDYCQWNSVAVAYSWESDGAFGSIHPKP